MFCSLDIELWSHDFLHNEQGIVKPLSVIRWSLVLDVIGLQSLVSDMQLKDLNWVERGLNPDYFVKVQ